MRKYIKIRNLSINIVLYEWKKKKSDFKIGDKVKCWFGNSGHKFYPELREDLTIKKMKYDFSSGYWQLNFGSEYYFYETDFEKLSN